MSLAVVTCYFNPANYREKKRNFLRMVRQMESGRVPIYIAELAAIGQPWVLSPQRNVLQLRAEASHALWVKENLINLGEKIVPLDYDAIAWIDADIWFDRGDWIQATEEALKTHPVVQMCESVIRTNRDGTVGSVQTSAAKAGRLAQGLYQPGMAWAARRSLWEVAGGLYERAVVGSGDMVNGHAFLDEASDLGWTGYSDLPDAITRLRDWVKSEGRCGFVRGTIWHEWHGDLVNRRFGDRHRWLAGLDVVAHLQKRPDGLIEWAPEVPTLPRDAVHKYFQLRKEDGEEPTSEFSLETLSQAPRIHERELAIIESLIAPSDRILEFGSAGSSLALWLSSRVCVVQTVEHDRLWANRLMATSDEKVVVHWRPSLEPYRSGTPGEWQHFLEYLNVPAQLGATWSSCLMNGRVRVDASLAIAPYLKPGGWLFFPGWFKVPRYYQSMALLAPFYELVEEYSISDTPSSLGVFRRRFTQAGKASGLPTSVHCQFPFKGG